MDADNARSFRLDPDTVRRQPHPGQWLKRLRDEYNRAVLATPTKDERQRRIIAYASARPGIDVDEELDLVSRMVKRHGHCVGHELRDSQGPHALKDRLGWREARRLLQAGFADGIAVISRDAISACDSEYEDQVHWIGHRPALLLLARHEATT
ncbi:hypothetical protein [Streptomyces sp. NPDC001020]